MEDPPKADDLTNRLEDIDQLLLWEAQNTDTNRKQILSSPML